MAEPGKTPKPSICLCMCEMCMPRPMAGERAEYYLRFPRKIPALGSHCCGPECSKKVEDKL